MVCVCLRVVVCLCSCLCAIALFRSSSGLDVSRLVQWHAEASVSLSFPLPFGVQGPFSQPLALPAPPQASFEPEP